MSLIDRFFEAFKKAEDSPEYQAEHFAGFTVEKNKAIDENDGRNHLFSKGLLIFAASFGLISAFFSEFEFTYNYLTVGILLFLFSMLLSFIHYKPWIFNISYPAIFVVFTMGLFEMRTLANSGFQAVINVVNETYSSHFLMQFTRESEELITDRYLTITVLAIFLGMFAAILINLTMFYSMNIHELFNLSFFPLLIGIYIGKYPSLPSMMLLIFAYVYGYILKCSGHYFFIDRKLEKEMPAARSRFGYILQKKRKKNKKNGEPSGDEAQVIFHLSDGKGMLQTALFSGAVALLATVILAFSVPASERASTRSTGLKATSDEYVKIFVQNGIYSLFNRYNGTGGMSNGRLGGVGSVRPDYEPDLNVTFVPYGYETVYLKGFTGWYYSGAAWETPNLNGLLSLDKNYLTLTEGKTLKSMMDAGDTVSMHGKMIIENLDAGMNNMYLPYYTEELPKRTYITDNLVTKGTFAEGSSVSMNYIPYSAALSDVTAREKNSFSAYRSVSENAMMQEYERAVYDNYLTVPVDFADQTRALREEIGVGQNAREQMSLIYQYFVSNYEYTLSPGSTPWNKDYVTYFLLEQKKGYCAHFATAGTLLLRAYGIPARYCEGYVVTPSAISERAVIAEDYDYDDFFRGENVLRAANENVLSVEVTDGEAHAWVEVYIDGYGWVVYDPTVPSSDTETTSYSDFLSAFSTLLGSSENSAQNVAVPNALENVNSFLSDIHLTDSPLLYVLLTGSLFYLALPYIKKGILSAKEKRLRKRDYAKGHYASTISYHYRLLIRKLKKKRPDYVGTLPEDAGRFLGLPEELVSDIQKSVYSKADIDKERADAIITELKEQKKHLLV